MGFSFGEPGKRHSFLTLAEAVDHDLAHFLFPLFDQRGIMNRLDPLPIRLQRHIRIPSVMDFGDFVGVAVIVGWPESHTGQSAFRNANEIALGRLRLLLNLGAEFFKVFGKYMGAGGLACLEDRFALGALEE